MNVIIAQPPNIKKIIKALGPRRSTTIYTFGSMIYNPGGGFISDDLRAHEDTHSVQQGADPDAWWAEYLKDPAFRYRMELAAYRNQYKFFRQTPRNRDRQKSFLFARKLASDLSSEIYGHAATYDQAFKQITNGI